MPLLVFRRITYYFGMNTGERLKELRIDKRLTQEALAEKVGTDGNTVSRWERNVLDISKRRLHQLASALDTSVGYLMCETDDPERHPTLLKKIAYSLNDPLHSSQYLFEIGPIATACDEVKAQAKYISQSDRIAIAAILKGTLEALEAAEEPRPEKPALDGDVA